MQYLGNRALDPSKCGRVVDASPYMYLLSGSAALLMLHKAEVRMLQLCSYLLTASSDWP